MTCPSSPTIKVNVSLGRLCLPADFQQDRWQQAGQTDRQKTDRQTDRQVTTGLKAPNRTVTGGQVCRQTGLQWGPEGKPTTKHYTNLVQLLCQWWLTFHLCLLLLLHKPAQWHIQEKVMVCMRKRQRRGVGSKRASVRKRDNTLIHKDKDLGPRRLFHKCVPDDKLSNTQYVKHEYK